MSALCVHYACIMSALCVHYACIMRCPVGRARRRVEALLRDPARLPAARGARGARGAGRAAAVRQAYPLLTPRTHTS